MDSERDGIILLLGVTGAGKSYFINQLKKKGPVTERPVREGHTLRSQTSRCQLVQMILEDDDGDERSISVVDTPGFDDTERPDGEVLAEITEFLATQHALGIPLKGVLYLHKITDNRMTGSSGTYLRLLQSLIGDSAMANVVLVTTMWYMLRDEYEGEGLRRQTQLSEKYWKSLTEKGAGVTKFEGTPESAWSIVRKLAPKEPVVLDYQRQVIEEGRDLIRTNAGNSLLQKLESTKVEYSIRLKDLEDQHDEAIAIGDKAVARDKEREISEAQDVLRRIDKSVAKLGAQPGPRIKEGVARAMKGQAAGRAVTVLAAILNITLFVVQLVVGV
ncbi:hypothetical protein QC761_704930 [Podospora bellae-mahoneyi]|uniref:AIG1-type G domain-containing protein n=1 Tax=Podospora bellae-mahoneyi TaxID=2093777 RepID=A0ABR0F680_9PEZI|nr:hypothetical protein QC761_704930 [Podospora bellae-mahoneyi]